MSIALVVGTADRVVAASDSRAYNESKTEYGDTVRKIDIRGGHLFAATGYGAYALEAWKEIPFAAGESAQSCATRVMVDLQDLLVPHADVAEILFGVFNWGPRADGYAIKARIAPGQTHAEIVQQVGMPDLPYALIFGWDEFEQKQEFLSHEIFPVLRSRPDESAMVDLAQSTIATATRQSVKVGGPVHVAVLDGRGSRWIARP